jgi:hypothetical protein
VVDEAVRDARLLGDVADPRGMEALPCEDAHSSCEQQLALLD